jgi:hypothetical protein
MLFDLLETENLQLYLCTLYLYFLGPSLRNTSKVLTIFEMRREATRLYEARFKDLVHAIFTKEKEFQHS